MKKKGGEISNEEESTTDKKGVLAPFLAKCYEMVEDPTTDSVISWSSSGGSFVIWDMILFQRDLLPKHFKHGNFSSFLRQLNTYGFRKSDPDRWEFENNHFIKGQKHLLRNIGRRKQTKNPSQQKEPEQKKAPVGACIEVGMFGLHQEVEMLKRDKNVLMQELVKCRQQQNNADYKLQGLRQSIRKMEKDQQQMLSLLVMAMQSPGFLAQLLQQNDNNWCIAETRKKRRLPALEQGTDEKEDVASDCQIVTYEPFVDEQGTENESVASDGQLVRYHPLTDETPRPLVMSMSNMDETEELDPSVDDFFMNIDFQSFGDVYSLLKEADLISSETDNQFVLPDVPEDDGILDQLLHDSPHSVDTEEMELNTPGDVEDGMGNEFTNDDTVMESIQSLDLVTKQMERLASDTSNTDKNTIEVI